MALYSYKDYDKNSMARVIGKSLPISQKQSIEICSFIRNKTVNECKKILADVIEKKRAVPYKRFNRDIGHKTGIGPGRYPIKASQHILKLLESAEANAQFKGLNTAQLIIKHISAQQAPKAWHYGRKSRRQMKRTHIEVVLAEGAAEKSDKKAAAKETKSKTQSKPKQAQQKPASPQKKASQPKQEAKQSSQSKEQVKPIKKESVAKEQPQEKKQDASKPKKESASQQKTDQPTDKKETTPDTK